MVIFANSGHLKQPIKLLNNLYGLYLSGCQYLKRLPEQLDEMKGLKMIDVSFTAIDKLSDSITQLKELAELNLFGCKKLTNLPDRLGEMKGLKKLRAGSSAIEKLPDSITQLKELFSLDLSLCKKLTNLPEQIGNMESLRTFDACHTAIEQLPDSFAGLINLVELDLGWCENLRNLPDNIWKLKLLKTLYLNGCSKLERLPKQLGEMQCLERLCASYTAIREVPDSIRLLSRLQILDLNAGEKLKYVPKSLWNLTSIHSLYELNKLTTLHLSCNVRLCLPMIMCFLSLKELSLTDEGQSFSSAEPVSFCQLFNLQVLKLNKFTNLGSSLPELPLNLEELWLWDHKSLEQLPDLSSLKLMKRLHIQSFIRLHSILVLPPHLWSLSVEDCTSIQDLPDLSMLKELAYLKVTECNNLKSISLKQSSLQVLLSAHLPNREVAEWFNYKSSGHTVTFDIPPSIESNILGLALWVVYTGKPYYKLINVVITNKTESITKDYLLDVYTEVGEALSRVLCISGEYMQPMKSGDRTGEEKGNIKIKMCGVHLI